MNEKFFPEIPTCTICLEELANELSSTRCGHVFHTHCIEQSIEIRSSCPNCKQKMIPSFVHPIIYSIGNVNAGKNAHLKFLEELTKEEQKEFAGLVDKNEDLFKENNKLKGEIKSYKTDLETIKAKNEESDKKMAEIIQEKEKMQEKKENYKNQYKGLKFDHEKMELEFKDLTAKHGILENDQKEFANLKKLKMKMTEEESETIKYTKDKCSLQEQANKFYQMILLKNVEIKENKLTIENLKGEVKELRKYKSLYEDKNGTNDRLKTDLENQRKLTEKYKVQLKDLKEKNSNGEKSVKMNENSNSNFETNDDVENIRIFNKNNENTLNLKAILAPSDTEFNMEFLIEKEDKGSDFFEIENQKISLKKDKLINKNNERSNKTLFNNLANPFFPMKTSTGFLKKEASPLGLKRLKPNNSSMQNQYRLFSQKQQSTLNSFLDKK